VGDKVIQEHQDAGPLGFGYRFLFLGGLAVKAINRLHLFSLRFSLVKPAPARVSKYAAPDLLLFHHRLLTMRAQAILSQPQGLFQHFQ
jgi:hypothetical protein